MAISRLGVASAAAASVALPTHQSGDLILIFAYRDGNVAPPALPAGYTNIDGSGANSTSARIGQKIAASASEMSGAWTGANRIVAVIYRGVDPATPIGGFSVNGAATATVTYGSVTATRTDGKNLFVAFAGHRSVNTNLQIPPTGMLNVTAGSVVDATCEVAMHEAAAPATTDWQAPGVSVGGTASGWRSYVVELNANAVLQAEATMAKVFILESTGQNVFNAVAHFPMPTGNNFVGVPWRTCYLASKGAETPTSVLLVGSGAGKISQFEADAILAGDIIELPFKFGDDPVLSTPERQARITMHADSQISEFLASFAERFRYYGYTQG